MRATVSPLQLRKRTEALRCGARVARERCVRELYAAHRHCSPIRVCRRPPAAPNIDRAQSTPQQRAYIHAVPVASELRESITRTTLHTHRHGRLIRVLETSIAPIGTS